MFYMCDSLISFKEIQQHYIFKTESSQINNEYNSLFEESKSNISIILKVFLVSLTREIKILHHQYLI